MNSMYKETQKSILVAINDFSISLFYSAKFDWREKLISILSLKDGQDYLASSIQVNRAILLIQKNASVEQLCEQMPLTLRGLEKLFGVQPIFKKFAGDYVQSIDDLIYSEFRKMGQPTNFDDDLYHDCFITCYEAFYSYKYASFSFSTYVLPRVRMTYYRNSRHYKNAVTPSCRSTYEARKYSELKDQGYSDEEIKQEVGLTDSSLHFVRSTEVSPTSGQFCNCLSDLVINRVSAQETGEHYKKAAFSLLAEAKKLSKREYIILMHGLELVSEPKSPSELAEMLGISRAMLSSTRTKIVSKLHAALRKEGVVNAA